MAAFWRRSTVFGTFKTLFKCSVRRDFRTGNASLVKQILREEKNGVTRIEGVFIQSPRDGKVLESQHNSIACPLCRLGIENLRHTDVLILSQFVDSEGCIIPQEVTGLCQKQHRICQSLIIHAQKAGLLPKNTKADDPTAKEGWRKPNTYFKKFSPIKHMDNRRSDKSFKKPY